ncbi:caspase family protein [uncultured Winogradskyella sp.]|uniref:caspase family protein n=1 Tax=uncultured Winogradskyella sp. TaxID=395353 RepID=UPI003515464D
MKKRYLLFVFTLFIISIFQPLFGQKFNLGLPIGHSSSVSSSKLIQNGKLLVTTSEDGSIGIWDFKSERLLYQLFHRESDKSFYLNSEISPDGTTIITWEWGKDLINVWNINEGILQIKIELNEDDDASEENYFLLEDDNINVHNIKYSADGKHLILSDNNGFVSLWNIETGLKEKEIKTNIDYIQSIGVARNNQLVYVAGDTLTEIWNLKKRKLIQSLTSSSKDTKPVFSADSKFIALQSLDNTIQVFNTKKGKLIHELATGFDDNNYDEKIIRISPNGKYLACSSSNNEAFKIWNLKSEKLEFVCDAHLNTIYSLNFSNDSNYIASSSSDNTAIVWKLDDKDLSWRVFSEHINSVDDVNFSEDDNYIITSSYDNSSIVWDYKSKRKPKIFRNFTNPVSSLELYTDDQSIITGIKNYALFWDLKTGKLKQSLENEYPVVNTELIKSDKKLLATTTEYLTFWDLKSNTKEKRFHSKLYSNILMGSSHFLDGDSEDFSKFFYGSDDHVWIRFGDGTTTTWNVVTGEENYVLFEPSYVLCSYYIKQYDVNILDLYRKRKDPTNFYEKDVLLKRFYGDNGFIDKKEELVAILDFKTVLIWNIKEEKQESLIENKSSRITNVEFTNDGKYIITSSEDGSLTYWNIKTGEKLITLYVIEGNEHIWQLPNGFYYATKKATSKLYYKNKTKTIGFEQLDVKYNRPDKVLGVLGDIIGERNTELINAYKKAWEKRIRKLDIDTTSFRQGFSVPESDFNNRDAITYEQTNQELKLQIKGIDSTYRLDRFNVWINEVPVYGRKGISLKSKKTHSVDTTLTVKLSTGKNKIETSVLNVNGIESYRQPLYVNYTPEEEVKEKLYFVGIGVDKYQEEGHDLNYSVKDIKDLSIQLKKKYGNLLEIDTLFNQNVSVSNIIKLKERLKNTTVDDKVIISFSGHGLLSKDLDYYLATYDVNFDTPEQNGLPYEDLEYLLDGIPSRKKLLLIDACHSGELDKEDVESIHQVEQQKDGLKGSIGVRVKKPKMGMKNSFELMKELFNNVDRATGTTVISAAAGTQFAQERGELKNGVFTYCILNQLREKETISVSELKTLVGKQVQEITNGLQQPTSRNETIENNWKVW